MYLLTEEDCHETTIFGLYSTIDAAIAAAQKIMAECWYVTRCTIWEGRGDGPIEEIAIVI